jgi:hypothetical protein
MWMGDSGSVVRFVFFYVLYWTLRFINFGHLAVGLPSGVKKREVSGKKMRKRGYQCFLVSVVSCLIDVENFFFCWCSRGFRYLLLKFGQNGLLVLRKKLVAPVVVCILIAHVGGAKVCARTRTRTSALGIKIRCPNH